MKIKYDYKISSIRFLAFCMIVLCHICQFYDWELAWWLNVGVEIFLCISGYLYGKRYKINNVLDFYKKRFIKICMPYYVTIVPVLLFYYFFVDKLSVIKIIKILLLNDTLDGGGHLWFVPLIIMCYLITPLLQLIFEKNNTKQKFSLKFIKSAISIAVIFGLFIPYFNLGYIICYLIAYCIGINERDKVFDDKTILYALCPLTLLNLIQIYLDYVYKVNFVGMALKLYKIFSLFNHIWLGVFFFLLLKNVVLSKKQYKQIEIRLLNKTDLYSYEVYLTHQFFILGPFSLMKLTSINLLNIAIVLFCIFISAYAVQFISEKLIKCMTNESRILRK